MELERGLHSVGLFSQLPKGYEVNSTNFLTVYHRCAEVEVLLVDVV